MVLTAADARPLFRLGRIRRQLQGFSIQMHLNSIMRDVSKLRH